MIVRIVSDGKAAREYLFAAFGYSFQSESSETIFGFGRGCSLL